MLVANSEWLNILNAPCIEIIIPVQQVCIEWARNFVVFVAMLQSGIKNASKSINLTSCKDWKCTRNRWMPRMSWTDFSICPCSFNKICPKFWHRSWFLMVFTWWNRVLLWLVRLKNPEKCDISPSCAQSVSILGCNRCFVISVNYNERMQFWECDLKKYPPVMTEWIGKNVRTNAISIHIYHFQLEVNWN